MYVTTLATEIFKHIAFVFRQQY